jgi:ribosomal protein S18 acetylase RimI-like enzyme
MIALDEIARLEESRLARAMADIATESRPFGGGVMARSEPGSWANYAVGFGLKGPVPREEIDAMPAWFEEKGIEPRLEVCPFADRSVLDALEALRFTVRQFEIIFYRELSPGLRSAPVVTPPKGLEVRPVDKSRRDELTAYARLAMSGFYPPGQAPSDGDVELAVRGSSLPRAVPIIAYVDGVPAGAGGLEISGEVATLYGVSVQPQFRGRGVQQAMIAERLNRAAESGARIATISSLPGSPTERNVRRMGFGVAYVKAVMVRPGPGLARIMI